MNNFTKTTRLDFQSENLAIDWISFNLPYTLEEEETQTVLNYLSDELGTTRSIQRPRHRPIF